ncbi:acyl-CoA thioesterase [Heliorestis convoluta]|uniref:Acyl-CoA thioesterase n=1 Tax=Heliorestis convoluta TaxID=356322 RepID=A0A5Q2N347_9FIRM|nr:acyl-CoA thioesterase [Heliorestis convoluta]QGG48289.1 acyl-CoA thioesterase [Heliorestis convoluta]
MEKNTKRMTDSYTVMTDLVFPNDMNHHHTIFGGKVMAYIDRIAAISAMRHCHKDVVTASTDSVDFLGPVKEGEILVLNAFVSFTRRTSMEVCVHVYSENPKSGERKLTTTAYLTFVAVDDEGRPTEVPVVIPETEEEKAIYCGGEARCRARMARRQKFKEKV